MKAFVYLVWMNWWEMNQEYMHRCFHRFISTEDVYQLNDVKQLELLVIELLCNSKCYLCCLLKIHITLFFVLCVVLNGSKSYYA